jgi:hypothetical protein
MPLRKPPLCIEQILAWADDHRERFGKYPNADSGPVLAAPSENWGAIDQALIVGVRGLPGKDTLTRLLMRERGRRHRGHLPPLTEEGILGWARDHHAHTGNWPNKTAGAVPGAPGEVWANVDQALRRGLRGLPGGDSLAQLLARRLGVSGRHASGPLSAETILAWADAHHEATGKWPGVTSPPVGLPDGEKWKSIDRALHHGDRGLPGGSSLARLLVERRGARKRLPRR